MTASAGGGDGGAGVRPDTEPSDAPYDRAWLQQQVTRIESGESVGAVRVLDAQSDVDWVVDVDAAAAAHTLEPETAAPAPEGEASQESSGVGRPRPLRRT